MSWIDSIFVILLCVTMFFVDINKQFCQGAATAAVAAWYVFRRVNGK